MEYRALGPHGHVGIDDQLRRVGDWRILGHGRRRGVDADPARGARQRRQFHRYRRRLRRRPKRAPGRPAACANGRASSSTSRRRRAADCRCRRPRATHARTSTNGWIAACATWTSKPSTCSSCTARRLRCSPTRACIDVLDGLVQAGKIRHYGVSVERIDEALEAIEHPGVETVQIIFNMFRPTARRGVLSGGAAPRGRRPRARAAGERPADRQAERRRRRSQSDDHRRFNRDGEAFDKGETFSGVPYEIGLQAVDELRTACAGRADDGADSLCDGR